MRRERQRLRIPALGLEILGDLLIASFFVYRETHNICIAIAHGNSGNSYYILEQGELNGWKN